MNYYPHHIGDFNNATRHLSRVERSIYRDLIELYYDTEAPLPVDFDQLCRKVIARTDEERTAVQQVLNEYFTQTDDGWFHDRCESVISDYRESILKKSAAGKASAAKRAAKPQRQSNKRSTDVPTPVQQVSNERATNQEPITNNQKPEKKNYSALDALILAGVPEKVAEDWLVLRKKKNLPPTQTAVDGLLKKLADAGMTAESGIRLCCERGWASFDQSWLTERRQPVRPVPTQSRHTGFDSTDYTQGVSADGRIA